jgi:hypothetical protein
MSNTSIELNLGIDFGTQFTKVSVRDTSLDSSWVVTFSNSNPSLNEALIPSKIGICSDGTILAGLTQSEWKQQIQPHISIDYIKMRLANLDLIEEENQYPSDSIPKFAENDFNTPENLENICAYYLSCVIHKAKQWVLKNNADLVKNQRIDWTANVGVPVKYCDSESLARFQKVLCFAWLLSELKPLKFNELKEKMTQLRKTISYDEIPCFAIPEIAAGIYSYTTSRQARPDVYIFFDIGSGTIEGASFRFWKENEMPKVDFYSAEVEALGVNALVKWVNNQVLGSAVQVEYDITENSHKLLQQIESLSRDIVNSYSLCRGDFIANKFKVTVNGINKRLQEDIPPQIEKLLYLMLGQSAIIGQVAKVIVSCQKKNITYFQQASSLVIFLGGGGRESEYYQDTIISTHTALNHHHADIPPYQVKEIPFPEGNFDMSGIERRYFHRFAVAYGLSIPEAEVPEVKLPSRFPIQTPPSFKPITPEIGRYPDDNLSM